MNAARKSPGGKARPRKSDPSGAKKSPLLPPPVKLPEAVEELFSIQDFTELGYRHIEWLRMQTSKTADDTQKLAKHDEIEKRIAGQTEGAGVWGQTEGAGVWGLGLLQWLFR